MFVADGAKSVEALLAPTDEPYRPEMQQYAVATELGVSDMWKLQLERSELQRRYLEQWVSYDGLDAILGESGSARAYSPGFNKKKRRRHRMRACRMVSSSTLVIPAYSMWSTIPLRPFPVECLSTKQEINNRLNTNHRVAFARRLMTAVRITPFVALSFGW